MQLHLIDGTYELFRAYFGAPPALGADGVEIGAARGLLRGMAALLREPACTHIAIAFDHVIESFRNDLFEGYKTGEGLEPELLGQFEIAEEVALALGITCWPMREFEADDAIATAAARYARDPRIEQVRLCSPDKDLAQCVRGERVVLVDRMRDRVIDEAGVREKWGVGPGSIPDWLGLVGDRADGIPGIPRWGQKSSAAVLAVYESIEAIPASETEWSLAVRGAKTLAANLAAERDAALLYKRLAILREDVPLEEDLDDLAWRGARRDLLAPLAVRLRDERILERIERWQD